MPRILHMLSQVPSQTGSGVYFENLVRECGKAGYQQAAVIGLPLHLQGFPLRGIPSENRYDVLFETPRLPFKIPGMSDVMPYDSTVFSDMDDVSFNAYRNSFREAAEEMIRRFRPDVILSNHLWVATAAACEAASALSDAVCRPRIFAICHGTDLRQMSLSQWMRPYVREQCGSLDGVFALNAHQAEVIPGLYGISREKVHITGIGYDNTLFYKPLQKRAGRNKKTELVYAGKLARAKGVNELVQAMGVLGPEAFRLTIAGKGSGAEAENILAAIAESEADICYMGQLNQKELAELFRSADIFVLPSYFEGLPLVVLEALASGMCVVVNDLDGLKEWLGETINESGRVSYVRMPCLVGVDACHPEEEEMYIRELADAISSCSKAMPGYGSEAYYTALEERSWDKVFERMALLFQAQASSRI